MLSSDETRIAKKKYWAHYSSAKTRNIAFELTYDQWIAIWLNSGHWHNRGNKRNQYCMSRYGDTGPYSQSNVFIQLAVDNTREGIVSRKSNGHYKVSTATRVKMSQAKKGKLKIKSSCLNCKSIISTNQINRHYISCRKKALRRGLSTL